MNRSPGADGAVADEEPDVATEMGVSETAAIPADAGAGAVGPSLAGATVRTPGDGRRRRTVAVVGAITAVLAVPLIWQLVTERDPLWYPLVDLVQIEMRVRDVGTSHPPLTGLGGRIFGLDTQGSHPGPLSFYLLAPVYRLAGGDPWGLQVSTAVLAIGAVAGSVWASYRRWGLHGALLVGAGLGVLMRMYGTEVLLYPWNPYLPVLFWMLFLVAVWAVLCRDLVLLPIAVVAGCLCAQTHLPYLGLVGGMGGLTVAGLAWQYRRAKGDAAERRRVLRWTAGSLALGALLWAPVLVEQLGGDPGNISILVDSFRHPTDDPVGLSTAWGLLCEHLNPLRLLAADRSPPASRGPGIALLVVWVASVAVAARLRDRTLVALHVVVAGALVLGLVTISRIFGATWFYLMLWAYGTATLVLVAIVATVGLAVRSVLARRDDAARFTRLERVPLAVAGIAVVAPAALLTRAEPATLDVNSDASEQLEFLVDPTVDAIGDGVIAGGVDGTFVMTWADPINLGGQGQGLMLELERQGYDARASTHARLSVRDHRVVAPSEADAEIHMAVGAANIDRARSHPGSVEVVLHDPRTREQVEAYARLRDQVIEKLVAAGRDDLVSRVDSNIIGLAARDDLPESVVEPLYIMGNLPSPIGVFTWDPTT